MTNKATLSFQSGFAIITLNDADKRNMLSAEMRADLLACYEECEKDESVQIIILNANGKHFCAGADINEMLTMSESPFDTNLQNARDLANFFHRIYLCEKPTICCIHGKALGGGVGLAAVHDICIAESNAAFSFPEVKLAMIPATIAPFISHRIGFSSAQSLMLTADMISAERALQIKLVDYLCEEDPINTGFLYAEKMLKNNVGAMRAAKKWLRELHPITPAQLEQAARLLAEIRGTTDAREALMARIGK